MSRNSGDNPKSRENRGRGNSKYVGKDSRYLSDKDKTGQGAAGLAKRKDHRIKEILKHELNNADNFSSLTLEAIEDLGDTDFIELIEQKIQKNRTEQTINEDWLISILEKLKENKTTANVGLQQVGLKE